MQTLKFCSAANSQQKEKCLIKLTSALFPTNNVNDNTNNVTVKSEYIKTESTAFDEDENKNENNNCNNNNNCNTNNKRTEISEYLHSCRNNTIYNESLLSQLYRENHLKLEDIKIDNTAASDATFWICDMIKSDCLLMYISSKETFLCNEYLDIHFINLNNENNFAKICVDSSNMSDYTILSGSFMDKSAEKKEYLIEDVLCYKSELINKTLYERMGLIGKTVGNFRQIRGKNNGLYPFDFRGKPWIPNNSPKGCVDFFKWYRQSSSTGNIMFHDGRHSENFSKGYMIWSNNHIAFRSKHTMFNYVYAPKFFVQIGLPIQARHNTAQFHQSDGHQQIGMTNKNGIVQDFNAMSNQSIQMWLRNDSDGLRSVCAIKAQFDAESMKKLIQISSTNTHNQWLLCSIIYNKAKSCYTLINILTETKITNIVEKNSGKYNKLLIKCGSTSTVHSASDKEKSTLLTSSVTEFVTNCTKMIQSVTKNDIIKAFQSLSKPVLVKQEKLKKQQLQLKQQQQHRHHNGHNNNRQHNRPYKQYIPDPPNYNSHNNNNTQY